MATIGTVDLTRGTALSERIAAGPTAPAAARELVVGLFGDTTIAEESLHDLLLLTTELVTNAVRHSRAAEGGSVGLSIDVSKSAVSVAVTDPGGETSPRMQELDVDVPGGMGLFLVDQISERWGVERAGAGAMRVWFELAR